MTDPSTETVAIYCLLDDYLKACGPVPDCRQRTSDAEIGTCALLSALLFDSNLTLARTYLQTHHRCCYLEKSQFSRRLERLAPLLEQFFRWLGRQARGCQQHYALDSFPVQSCRNCRIIRSKRLKGKQYRGYCASKREYFFGYKAQVVATSDGLPVDWLLMEGSRHDSQALKTAWTPDLEAGNCLYADSAYQDGQMQDCLLEGQGVELLCQKRSNAKEPHPPYRAYLIDQYRKGIETLFASITRRMGRYIQAVTDRTFAFKIMLCIWASTIEYLIG